MEAKRKKRLIIYGVVLVLLLVFNCLYFSFRVLKPADLKPVIRKKSHQVLLLDQGKEALLLRIALIRQAKKSICIQTFIWTDDEAGMLVMNELIKAAQRGVKVRIIADQMFSVTDPGVIAALATLSPNLEIKHHNPLSSNIDNSTLAQISSLARDFHGSNMRMHNKLMIVDSKWGMTGGRNIEDTYYDNARGLNFKDRDVLVTGPVVNDMQKSFESYWEFPLCISSLKLKDIAAAEKAGKSDLSALKDIPLEKEVDRLLKPDFMEKIKAKMLGVRKVAFFADIPGKEEMKGQGSRITRQFIAILLNAKKSVLIQSPYLVFGPGALEFFAGLKDKNIQVTASTNSLAATDSWPTYAMLYKQKKHLINDLGIHLYEFKPLPKDIDVMFPDNQKIRKEMLTKNGAKYDPNDPDLKQIPYLCLHAKSMVVDDDVGVVGSFNFDPRSANLNTEVALVVWDKKFASQLAENIQQDIKGGNSWVIWKRQRPAPIKFGARLTGLFNRTVEGATTLDLWPAMHTASFELKDNKEDLLPGHEKFYEHYEEAGSFPMVSEKDEKKVYTRLFKAFGKVLTPIL